MIKNQTVINMNKKALLSFLLLYLPLAVAADDVQINGLWYNIDINGNTAQVIQYKNNVKYEGDIVIPSTVTYDGVEYSVTKIGNNAFSGCSSLTGISIPQGVTSISNYAFNSCSNLVKAEFSSIESLCRIVFTTERSNPLYYAHHLFVNGEEVTNVIIPTSVTNIGKYSFYGCSSLTEINILQGVTSIGSCAFYGCSSLTEINIPQGVTTIGDNAFYGCSSLAEINIPLGVTSIGYNMFYGCSSLTGINIPQGVTSIGNYAFSSCSSLTEINIPQGVTSIGSYAFWGCSSLAEINIPQGVTSIGSRAFYGCSSLTEINIPQGVTTIGSNTFYGCSHLAGINIPQGVTSIGESAFYGCSSLTGITIPDGVTCIGQDTFRGCSSLTEIIIPQGVTSIGSSAFSGCSSLTEIIIPQGVTSIGSSTFSGCSSLTEINIPQGVTSIGSSAFRGCSSLTKAEFSSIESLCNIRFKDSYSNPLYYAHHLFVNGEEVTNVIISTSVTSIGNYTFYGCSYLTEINIPQGVTSIGSYTFYGCSGLTEINIPQGVTSIGSGAFYGCSSLTGIIIPDGVTSIAQYTFENCSSLTEINIPQGVTSIGSGAFYNCSSLTKAKFSSIESLCNIRFNESYSNPLSYAHHLFINGEEVTNVIIPTSVTSIGEFTFYGCSYLTEINIPQGVTSIGRYAFNGCSSLTGITIPDGVTNIGEGTFSRCSDLLSIVCLCPTPPTCGSSAFYNVPTYTCILYVPAESIEAYSTTYPWNSFTNIRPFVDNAISEAEWAILGTIKDELVEKGWSKPWDMSVGISCAESLQGITLENKHVTQLNLSNCQLNGSFPYVILQLPYLEQLNLSYNQLSGDVCTGIDATNPPTALQTLTTINLSHNQLTGNIGAFASHLPHLQSLNASYNSLTEVNPIIPSTVTDLNIGYQSIDQTYDFDLTNPSHDYLYQQLPSLLRYDHASQSYKNTIRLLCTAGDVTTYNINMSNSEWGAEFTLDHEQGGWSIPIVSSNYAFHGENGSQLQAMLLKDNRQKTGTTFGLTLHFASGDANFDGDVDVTDLQASILEIMAQHGRSPFNFTAADINNDNDLNVLDIIMQVNQLMSLAPNAASRANKQKANTTTTSDASVFADGSDLIVYSDTPVAAFDIRVANATLLSLSEELTLAGITCSVKDGIDGLHLIGYSLSGGLLPTGKTCIAKLKGTAPSIASATLSDGQANKIITICNQQPTGIRSVAPAQVDIHQEGHQIAICSDGSGGTLSWQIVTSDGRLVGKGDIDNRNARIIPIDIRHHGLLIVTVSSANQTLINKIINIR